jgi:acyl-CoA reductase-like NAD-dependent aldehyde dehydrogenase
MLEKHLWIGGKPHPAKTYRTLRSPYSGEALASIAEADEEETDLAIESADRAASAMRDMPAHKRAAILEKVVQLLGDRAEEAAVIIAKEAAKPISAARAEIARTMATYKFSAEEAKRISGETIPLDAAPGGEGRLAFTKFEPLGVIGAITPFNFPFNLVAHKLGPAIAAGNAVVLKPASQTPLSAFFIGELFQQAGLPDGALNIVTGSGRIVGERIVADSRVRKITFTGSPEVGIALRSRAGLKRVTLELGSNSAVIVDRGTDIGRIVQRCVAGAFSYQGQVCISVQRIYVHEEIYESFTAQFVEAVRRLRLGDPLDEKTDVSALISEQEAVRVMSWIEEARNSGAVVAAGGIREGGIVHPTVLLEASPHLSVSCREAFAPIAVIGKVSSIDEAVDLANDSRYGLQAGIYTNDIGTALRAADRLQVGGVIINDIPTYRADHMPYGGVKESGYGREGVKYAMRDMMEMKLVVINRE